MCFGNYFQFSFICHQAHSSISLRLEMASDCVKYQNSTKEKMESSFEFCELDVSHFRFRLYFYSLAILFFGHFIGFFFFSVYYFFFYYASTLLVKRMRGASWKIVRGWKGKFRTGAEKIAVKVWRTITPGYLERLYQLMPWLRPQSSPPTEATGSIENHFWHVFLLCRSIN